MKNILTKYGLIGWPVSHSLSPNMHNAAFKKCNISSTYELLPINPSSFNKGIEDLKTKRFLGWNVTVPYKEQMFKILDEVDISAKNLGSVNTIVNNEGHLKGYSTDGYGLEKAILESFNVKISNSKFIFAGTGGAARASSIDFVLKGASSIVLLNRTLSKAEKLAEELKTIQPEINIKIYSLDDLDSIKKESESSDVLIQSTSLGLHADDPMVFNPEILSKNIHILDMIYHRTPFLEKASSQGYKVTDGSLMLLYQGVKAWEIWTGEKAPIKEMHEALRKGQNS